MRPTHITDLFYSEPTDLNRLIPSKNPLKAMVRLVFDQAAGYHSLAKMTHEINCYVYIFNYNFWNINILKLSLIQCEYVFGSLELWEEWKVVVYFERQIVMKEPVICNWVIWVQINSIYAIYGLCDFGQVSWTWVSISMLIK